MLHGDLRSGPWRGQETPPPRVAKRSLRRAALALVGDDRRRLVAGRRQLLHVHEGGLHLDPLADALQPADDDPLAGLDALDDLAQRADGGADLDGAVLHLVVAV